MRSVVLLFAGMLTVPAIAQNIGINASGAAPDASAVLDLDVAAHPAADKKGLLIPRMALTATNVAAPVVAPATSLLVYNTATAGAPPNNVTPGFYYWNGTTWVRFGMSGDDWRVTGNAGTNPAVNFIGTTDNQDLVVRTNNTERMRVMGATGRVGVNTTAPTTFLDVSSPGLLQDAVYGHSPNVGGVLGREVNFSFGVPLQTINGAGVYANNPTAGYTSIYAQSTGAATVAANVNFSDVWMAQYNYTQNGSAVYNPAGTYSQLNVTNAALTGNHRSIWAYSGRGTTAGNPGFTEGSTAFAVAQNQDCDGVVGISATNSTIENAGGYFESDTYAGGLLNYAWVGARLAGVGYKITGAGAVAEIIPTPDHGRITLVCPESPEYWYQDYGTVALVNGFAHVELDPILQDIIVVDAANPMRVYCTPVDMPYFNGVTVMNKTATGFDIRELNGGTHSGAIDYQVIVKPKTNFGMGRFAQAPPPHGVKPWQQPEQALAANRPDPAKVFNWPSEFEVYPYDPDKTTPIGSRVRIGPNAGKWKLAEGVYSDHIPAKLPGK
ncbi:MAG: hypothetical protein GFGODING_02963 [Flavobacteriales bacterium]|nr:hypothetical protein [Flavobacteriales bacterium]